MEQHNRIDMLNMLACCFTEARLMASQVAVLTTIARFPGIKIGRIAYHTALSDPHTGRMLRYLQSTGDIACSVSAIKGNRGRKWFITSRGVQTINGLYRRMMPHKGAKFVIQEYQPDNLFDL